MSIDDMLTNYPENRIRETKERLRQYWDGEDLGRSAVSVVRFAPQYRQVRDMDTMMQNALECLISEAFLPGDNVPAFMPDLGPVTLASAFGGRIRYDENGPPWIDPVITDPAEVDTIRKPSCEDGLVGDVIYRAQVFLERCDGKIHVRPTDMQGPLNVAGLVWEQQNFLMAMHTHPEAVHKLMALVTEFEIDVLRTFQSIFGDRLIHPFWPHFWMPPEFGVAITEDLLPLLSAASYREFGLPYTTRISDAFGGLFVHCCGECEHHLPALAEIPNLRGLEFSYPHTRPEVVKEVLGTQRVYSMGLSSRGEPLFENNLAFLAFAKRQVEGGLRIFFVLPGDNIEELHQKMSVLGLTALCANLPLA